MKSNTPKKRPTICMHLALIQMPAKFFSSQQRDSQSISAHG